MIEIGLLSIAVLAVILAAAMSAIAWRLHRDERGRSEARVAALSADIHSAASPRESVVGIRSPSPRMQPMAARKFVDIESVDLRQARADSSPELFRFEPSGRSGSRLAPVLALGIFAVVSALALIIATGRAARPAGGLSESTSPVTSPSIPASSTGSAPLELVALGQDRDGDRITVRGVVRNPSGKGMDRLTAVVLLFNRRGDFLGTGRAPIEAPTLASGSQAAFRVTVAHVRDVGRYRIRFHKDDHVVPHVDRRPRGPAADTN